MRRESDQSQAASPQESRNPAPTYEGYLRLDSGSSLGMGPGGVPTVLALVARVEIDGGDTTARLFRVALAGVRGRRMLAAFQSQTSSMQASGIRGENRAGCDQCLDLWVNETGQIQSRDRSEKNEASRIPGFPPSAGSLGPVPKLLRRKEDRPTAGPSF
jgi:hypothetical protein